MHSGIDFGNRHSQVVAGPLSPGSSTAVGPALLGGYAGSALSFAICPRDEFGNLWMSGMVSVAVSAQVQVAMGGEYHSRSVNVPATVNSQEDGSFLVEYTATQASTPSSLDD